MPVLRVLVFALASHIRTLGYLLGPLPSRASLLAGSYIVEFDMPAYPGLYPSFLVVFPFQAQGPRAFYKQLAATTNYTGNFTILLDIL